MPGDISPRLRTNSAQLGNVKSVIYASATLGTGNAVVAQGSTTYGTDQTAALQQMLKASQGGVLVIDGQHGILGSLAILSHTTIVFPENCGLIRIPGGIGPMLYNAGMISGGAMAATARGVGGTQGATAGTSVGATLGSFVNANICIQGGIFNGNGQNLSGNQKDTLYGFYCPVQFFGVDNLCLRDVTVYDGPNYQHVFCNCRHVWIENGVASASSLGATQGTDCYHFNGPCQFVGIKNIITDCGDDNIALNADDGYANPANRIAPYPGPLTDFHIDGWHMNNTAAAKGRGIRMLSNTQRIDRIVVQNVTGNASEIVGLLDQYWAFQLPPAYQGSTFGNGNWGTITFRNIQVNILEGAAAAGDITIKGTWMIDAQNGQFVFDNCRITSPAVAQAMIYIDSIYSNNSAQDITITNCEYNERSTTGNNAPLVILNGRAKHLQISNSRCTRSSTITGADSPILKVTGTNAPLAAESIILSDCYTDNVNSMVEVTGGRIGLLKVSGYHHNSGSNYGVTIASGATVDNLDTLKLVTDANSGTNWSNAGTITNNITTGGTFAIRSGIANLWDGLMAYYRFAENASTTGANSIVDQLGNYNLTPHAATAAGTNNVNSGNAAKFSAQWYYSVDTGGTAPRLLASSNQQQPYTIAGWVQIQNAATFQIIMSRGDGSQTANWGYLAANGSGDAYAEAGGTNNNVTGSAMSTGTWYHIALVADPFALIGASPFYYLYLNGVAQGHAALTVPSAPLTSWPLVFGSLENNSDLPLLSNALLCGWGVWAIPLNVYQIGLAYNGGTGIYVI